MRIITFLLYCFAVSSLFCCFYVFFFCFVMVCYVCFFFFFSSRRRHTRSLCDWSSDVCSSDLSGAELVGELHQPPVPDVVLLATALPDVDGLTVLAKMRSHPVLKYVPVIVLAPDAARDRLLKALRSDVQGYFTEPFEVDVVLLAVKTVLGLAGTAAGAELTVDWSDDRSVPGAR